MGKIHRKGTETVEQNIDAECAGCQFYVAFTDAQKTAYQTANGISKDGTCRWLPPNPKGEFGAVDAHEWCGQYG